MVAIPGLVETADQQRVACKQGTLHASTWPSPEHDHMALSLSKSWSWQLQEEPPQYPSTHYGFAKSVAAIPTQVSNVSPLTLTPSKTYHCSKQQQPYSLSSQAAAFTSRSAISSIYTTSGSGSPTSDSSHGHAYTSSPAASDIRSPQLTSLWDDDAEDESAPQQLLPPLDPCDHMKTLLTQLASCISAISTAYGHQQAAMHSHNAQLAATDGAEDGRGVSSTKGDVISTTDKAMVEELESLSRLHSQLALLPRRLPFNVSGAAAGRPDMIKEADQSANSTSLQLRRYEEIIGRFHDEICRKDAVVEALKETLAKSMLRGEKLHRRVQALEAKLRPVKGYPGREVLISKEVGSGHTRPIVKVAPLEELGQ